MDSIELFQNRSLLAMFRVHYNANVNFVIKRVNCIKEQLPFINSFAFVSRGFSSD